MPLLSAFEDLTENIEIAYDNVSQNGSSPGSGPTAREGLASDMGDAIDEYYNSALVTTSVTIDAGQPDTVGGTTQVDGTGSGTGGLTLLDIATLKIDLQNAYDSAADTGGFSDPVPQLAQDVGTAIHTYMISGTVITTVVADGGQTTSAAAATANPVGTVASPGSGTGKGIVRYEDSDIDTLISDIETAYENAKLTGQTGSASKDLSIDMSAAIQKFALTAIVETDVTVQPGQTVAGYMMLVGTAASPLPATTLITTAASGEGELS